MPYSDNCVKAAIDIATGANHYVVAALLTQDENTALTSRNARIKRDLTNDFEKALLTNTTHQLRYDRHNNDVIYFRSTPGQEAHLEARLARYWYRAMKVDEFKKHKREGEFVEMDGFGGVAPNRNYSKGYLTNESAESIMLEWDIPAGGNLYTLMTANGINIKAEGGGTYGLGEEGTQDHRPGIVEKLKSRVIFNSVSGRFKVVDLRIPNRMAACVG